MRNKFLCISVILGALLLSGCGLNDGDKGTEAVSKLIAEEDSTDKNAEEITTAERSTTERSTTEKSTTEITTTETTTTEITSEEVIENKTVEFSYNDVPEFNNNSYVEINNNIPFFSDKDLTKEAFESYSDLDSLGRCGVAFALLGKETMPMKERRGEIGDIKPSGWHTVKYPEIISDNYLYNRCHLIAFQLAGENDNEKNLITGTRYFNVSGMEPFENKVASYIENTNNHVLYRVTPIYNQDDLVATGVLMEARSVEDNGKGLSYCVFVYNYQPGIIIDYQNGDSKVDETYVADNSNTSATEVTSEDKTTEDIETTSEVSTENNVEVTYIINLNTKKFHRPTCSSVNEMNEKNKDYSTLSRDEIINQGYVPCKRCNP